MMGEFRAIDADGHVIEPPDLYHRHASAALREQGPQFLGYLGGWVYREQMHRDAEFVAILRQQGLDAALAHPYGQAALRKRRAYFEIRPEVAKAPYDPHATTHPPGAFSPQCHLEYMDKVGFEQSVIYPSFWLAPLTFDGLHAGAGELAGIYNRWLADWCSAAPERLRGVGMVSVFDAELAAREVETIATGHGFRAIVVGTCPDGRTWDDRRFDALWRACEAHDVSVGFHPMFRPKRSGQRLGFDQRFGPAMHWMDEHLTALIRGGVLERHPKLRVAFLESGCGWVPFMLWRLDESYWEWRQAARRSGASQTDAGIDIEVLEQNVRIAPSDYFRRQCWVACEASEPYLRQVADVIGDDRLLVASDFPHADHDPYAMKTFPEIAPAIGAGLVRKMLWDNPARFYGLA